VQQIVWLKINHRRRSVKGNLGDSWESPSMLRLNESTFDFVAKSRVPASMLENA
jgi:hypothetical protein